MRTTLDIDSDVLDVARGVAEARQISIGKALSYLARRGAAAQAPLSQRNGFCIFALGEKAPQFGPDDVRAALEREDEAAGRMFVDPER